MNSITSPRQIPLITAKTTLAQSWARQLILRMLIHLHHGQLIVKEKDQAMTFGYDDSIKGTIYVRLKFRVS